MIKIYFNVIFLVLCVILELGGVLPTLISDKQTINVWIGVFIGIFSIPLYYLWIQKIIQIIKKQKELKNV